MATLDFNAFRDDASFYPDNNNSLWQDAKPSWHCPICDRSKADIVRLTHRGDTYARLVSHHCHIGDTASKLISEHKISVSLRHKFESVLARFDPIVVCEDCNAADMTAKRFCNAAKYFSFSPSEIKKFIEVKNNRNHVIDEDKARKVYEELKGDLNAIFEAIGSFAELASNTKYYDNYAAMSLMVRCENA